MKRKVQRFEAEDVLAAGRHTELAKLIKNSEHLLEATLDMDEEAAAKAIENAHQDRTFRQIKERNLLEWIYLEKDGQKITERGI